MTSAQTANGGDAAYIGPWLAATPWNRHEASRGESACRPVWYPQLRDDSWPREVRKSQFKLVNSELVVRSDGGHVGRLVPGLGRQQSKALCFFVTFHSRQNEYGSYVGCSLAYKGGGVLGDTISPLCVVSFSVHFRGTIGSKSVFRPEKRRLAATCDVRALQNISVFRSTCCDSVGSARKKHRS